VCNKQPLCGWASKSALVHCEVRAMTKHTESVEQLYYVWGRNWNWRNSWAREDSTVTDEINIWFAVRIKKLLLRHREIGHEYCDVTEFSNFMEQNPSWVASSFSAGQEIPLIFMSLKVRYRVDKSSLRAFVSILDTVHCLFYIKCITNIYESIRVACITVNILKSIKMTVGCKNKYV
jgi:hypothetical protein